MRRPTSLRFDLKSKFSRSNLRPSYFLFKIIDLHFCFDLAQDFAGGLAGFAGAFFENVHDEVWVTGELTTAFADGFEYVVEHCGKALLEHHIAQSPLLVLRLQLC